ncbi:hypothetical protein MBLNU230_g1691t1 [Neophaeotheca triangularis]
MTTITRPTYADIVKGIAKQPKHADVAPLTATALKGFQRPSGVPVAKPATSKRGGLAKRAPTPSPKSMRSNAELSAASTLAYIPGSADEVVSESGTSVTDSSLRIAIASAESALKMSAPGQQHTEPARNPSKLGGLERYVKNTTSASSPAENNWDKLPVELHQKILGDVVGQCTIRRHVVKWLNALFGFTESKRENSVQKTDLIRCMRPYEREAMNKMLRLRLVSNNINAELYWVLQDWLSQPPMSIQQLKEVLAEGRGVSGSKSLVLEIFSFDDLHRCAETIRGGGASGAFDDATDNYHQRSWRYFQGMIKGYQEDLSWASSQAFQDGYLRDASMLGTLNSSFSYYMRAIDAMYSLPRSWIKQLAAISTGITKLTLVMTENLVFCGLGYMREVEDLDILCQQSIFSGHPSGLASQPRLREQRLNRFYNTVRLACGPAVQIELVDSGSGERVESRPLMRQLVLADGYWEVGNGNEAGEGDIHDQHADLFGE